jgi:hypothetical protein
VSAKGEEDFPGQLVDAERFLSENMTALKRVLGLSSVDVAVLDFAVGLRIDDVTTVFQFDRVPSSLIRTMSALPLNLEISLYPRGVDADGVSDP